MAQPRRLPSTVRHVWLVDRGILSRPLLRALERLGHRVVGRVRCNQVVCCAPTAEGGQQLNPWYLLTTDRALEPQEAVRAYDGRYQIEVNIDEVKELGLAHYQGRSAQGIRRWPLFLSLGQMILCIAVLQVETVTG